MICTVDFTKWIQKLMTVVPPEKFNAEEESGEKCINNVDTTNVSMIMAMADSVITTMQ